MAVAESYGCFGFADRDWALELRKELRQMDNDVPPELEPPEVTPSEGTARYSCGREVRRGDMIDTPTQGRVRVSRDASVRSNGTYIWDGWRWLPSTDVTLLSRQRPR